MRPWRSLSHSLSWSRSSQRAVSRFDVLAPIIKRNMNLGEGQELARNGLGDSSPYPAIAICPSARASGCDND